MQDVALPDSAGLDPETAEAVPEATPPGDRRAARAAMQARIIAPVKPLLRRAGLLSILSGLLWPVQAAAIAWAVSGWAGGALALERSLWAAGIFLLCGLIRAGLDRVAGGLLYRAADETIAREREVLIGREARRPGGAGSAAVAALAVQKLPLLHPWITRYHVAMLRTSVIPLVYLAVAFWFSWAIGVVLLVAGPLIPVFMALVGMAAEDASRRQMDEIGDMNTMLMDRLSALLDIRLLGARARAAEDFETRADRLREKTMAVLRIAFLSSTVLELFAAIGVAMVAVFVGFTLLGEVGWGSWGNGLTLYEGIFLLLIAPEFFQPLRDLAAAWHDRASGVSVVEELEAMDAAPRVALLGEGTQAAPLPGPLSVSMRGGVASLPGRALPLPDLDLDAGQSLALVGPSGVGKSTALSALAGLVPLVEGRIEVCGQELNAGTADGWRARLAVVPQRVHFPDLPLGDWLSGGRAVDEGTMTEALELAEAHAVVDRLPEGLQTRLGESGGGVSGGEARRLMIARAVLQGADLVLADEPTADLDALTADRVTRALRRLQGQGAALIVATHDPALAGAMDAQILMTGEAEA
ncbi:ATP-binding cassette domain-containing protein [Ferrimonas balearica]|nr:ATP-binding cassette domain-containing protein [Ferrimonas balearica]